MANGVDSDQYRSSLFWIHAFASINSLSVMLGNYLQQTTSADVIFRCIFFLSLYELRGGSVVVDSMLIGAPIVGFCNCSMFCCALLCVKSTFAINLMGKRERVALTCLYSWCLSLLVWLFILMPRLCLQFVFVVFPDRTHVLFLIIELCTHVHSNFRCFIV